MGKYIVAPDSWREDNEAVRTIWLVGEETACGVIYVDGNYNFDVAMLMAQERELGVEDGE